MPNKFKIKELMVGAIIPVISAGAGLSWFSAFPKNAVSLEEKVVCRRENSEQKYGKVIPDFISERGISLIKEAEGFSSKPYQDVDHLAIGYGHWIKQGEKLTIIDEAKAIELLREDIQRVKRVIDRCVHVSLTQNQYDALCSFIYNVGERNFKNSTLLKKLNNKDYTGASEEFKRWIKSNQKPLKGLEIRRRKEYELFISD